MANSMFQEHLKKDLLINQHESMRLIARAPYAYKKYNISKANGGVRKISQPAKETKYIMNWLVAKVFTQLPIHESATAYYKGCSVKANAEHHMRNKYMVKFDFKNFFPSIGIQDILHHLTKHHIDKFDFDKESLVQIARVCCIKDPHSKFGLSLSVGSPASPVLSNSVMYEFDSKISKWSKDNNVVYTRYADDLTFSTNEKGLCFNIKDVINLFLKEIEYPSLSLNEAKTIYVSKRGRRQITGVVVNNENNLSLGRKRKRVLSSLIHKLSLGQLNEEERAYLQGMLGFAKDVEPTFLSRMERKYGSNLILAALKNKK